MTDTKQASELFELCKEVYKRFPEWNDTLAVYEQTAGIPEGKPYIAYPELERKWGLWGTQELKKHTPLYTSDYLLEKLQPFKTEAKGNRGDMMPVNAFVFVRGESKNEFRAGYRYNLNGAKYSDGIYADTPLKALLKLTIALSEAGELK